MKKVLILGFGDLASRLTPIIAPNYQVVGLSRSEKRIEQASLYAGDCRDRATLLTLIDSEVEVIVLIMTPDSYDDEGYRHAYVDSASALINTLDQAQHKPRRIVFISSTSVYGQNNGECINESSPTEPPRYNGKRVLEAEQLLLSSQYPTTVIRFGGIYGRGGNRKLQRISEGQFSDKPNSWTNRMHADDCARALAHIIEVDNPEPIYVGCDNEPVLMAEMEAWLAAQLLVEVSAPKVSAGSPTTNKQCSNQRLRDSGFECIYPSYREGYTAFLQAMCQSTRRS